MSGAADRRVRRTAVRAAVSAALTHSSHSSAAGLPCRIAETGIVASLKSASEAARTHKELGVALVALVGAVGGLAHVYHRQEQKAELKAKDLEKAMVEQAKALELKAKDLEVIVARPWSSPSAPTSRSSGRA